MGLAKILKAVLSRKQAWQRRPEVLLCQNVPKPMHGVTPRTILGGLWWNATRHSAYALTDFHCVACGVHKLNAVWHQWLEGHELYEIDYLAGRMTYVETVPLCHFCHCFIHDGRLQALLDKGEVTKEKYDAVMEHGRRVLHDAGLKKTNQQGPSAAWGDWRLVLFGKEHPPIYKDFAAWAEAFAIGSDDP